MFNWNTGDEIVDANLRALEHFSSWSIDSDERLTDMFLNGVIGVQEMLPKDVKKHFKFPNLFVAGAHYSLGSTYRRNLIGSIAEAIRLGLASLADDATLTREANPDFSDRPRSRGEEILEAVRKFRKERDAKALAALQHSAFGTNLGCRIQSIERLMKRTKSVGNQSPEAAMSSELYRLELEARNYFVQKL